MNIVLYESFSKRKNSTKRPTGGISKSVVLKDGTSHLHPEFLVSSPSFPLNVNYCSWGGYYYYVVDIVLEGNSLYRIKCELDVMATFKTEIGNYTTMVSRAASDQNYNVVDSIYPALASPTTKMLSITNPGIFTSNISNGTVVMGTVGNDGQHYYCMSWARFQSVCNWLFPSLGMTFNDWVVMNVGQALAGGLNTVLDAITVLKWLPISYSVVSPHLTATADTKIGNWTMPHANSEIVGNAVAQILGTNITFPNRDDNGSRGKWLYMSPFADYSLYIPPFGKITVDGTFLVPSGRQVTVDIMAEFITGNVTMRLYYALGNTAPKMVGVYNANVGLDMRAGGGAANFGGIVSGIGGAVSNAISENYKGAAASIISAATSMIPQGSQIGGGVSGPTPDISANWMAYATYYDPIEENQSEFGRPLAEVVQIGTLSGFVQCADASISIPGHSGEMDEVNAMLNGGFFYE